MKTECMEMANQMQEQMQELDRCLEYFRARPVYGRLFEGFRKKYESLGHFGGSVKLDGLSAQDCQDLAGFLQKDFAKGKSVTISAAALQKALDTSRFAGLSWECILEAYSGRPLTVKKEIAAAREAGREEFFKDILKSAADDGQVPQEALKWLEGLISGNSVGHGTLMQQYREDRETLRAVLRYVLRAAGTLKELGESGKREYLPVFSASVTGDPHYFDWGGTAESLLYSYIKERYGDRVSGGLTKNEYKNRLYYEAGLIRDEISNDVTAYGIRARMRGGGIHPGIEGFYAAREPVKLTLSTLGGLESASAGDGGPVYVVENPAVFSYLAARYPKRAFICGYGQVKLAVLVLMDLLAEDDAFYYAGDYDPEGLLIAQRLKLRYRDRLKLWKYDTGIYDTYLSGVELGPSRLKKLDRITIDELKPLADTMRERKMAAYQETMLEVYGE